MPETIALRDLRILIGRFVSYG